VKDNAGGIAKGDFARAFRPASIPTDRSGLAEFGMGMKSAACWFSPRWHVRTKAHGETVERSIAFDIERIVNDQIEELVVSEVSARGDAHFTEIVLDAVHHLPVKKTLAKIKEHLADIYRVFMREGLLDLYIGDECLKYAEPSILVAPYERRAEQGPRTWRKDIDFDLGGGMRVTGFAALRDPGNFARSGFSLFRRRRVIQGSGDEGYRPRFIFGQPGSFRSLRLFGELHLEGFDVSHTKDGFRWDENEQPFLELLKEHLDSPDLPLLKQADGYRALSARADRAQAADEAVTRTVGTMERTLPAALEAVADKPLIETATSPLTTQEPLAARDLAIDFRGERWLIRVELTDDPAEGQWLSISDQASTEHTPNLVHIRVSVAHPFMLRFAQTDPDDIEALLRVAAGIGLGEKLARRVGHRYAGSVRRNMNDLLRESLCHV